MPPAFLIGAAVVGAAGAIGSGIASAAVAGSRKKYAEYVPPDLANFSFDAGTRGAAQEFYDNAYAAQKRQIDPYAEAQQKALVSQLQQMAAGKGPSAAQGMLQAGTDDAIRSAMALSGSARGNALGAAQLNAVNAGTLATAQAANQAAILRAQEQQAAIGQLGGVLSGMRQASLNEAQRRDQLEQFYMSLGASREEAALRAKMMYEQEVGQRKLAYQQLAAQEEGAKIAGIQTGIAGVGQGFSSLAGSSAYMYGKMIGGGKKGSGDGGDDGDD
jgi:hypothetical protein